MERNNMQLWTAFLLGLAGSLHCAGMCGPLMLALAKARPSTMGQATGRVFYHIGRAASYCLLGVMAGFLSHIVAPAGFQRWLSVTLGAALIAGLLISARVPLVAPVLKWVAWLKGSLQWLLSRNSLMSQMTMGALNGLLPCGLVYVAAAGAAATGHPLTGAAYMALFGLGTWPMLLGIHFVGQRLPLPSRLSLGRITRAAVLLMAVLLILRGLELGIPFVSPDLTAAGGNNARCH
jgi:sulfite exporter TauE/SafE